MLFVLTQCSGFESRHSLSIVCQRQQVELPRRITQQVATAILIYGATCLQKTNSQIR